MRQFKVWKYVVSHSRLLIRSPKNEEVLDDVNIDIVFDGVGFLMLAKMDQRLSLETWDRESFEATQEEVESVMGLNGDFGKRDRLFVVRGNSGVKWYVIASHVVVRTNQMYALETPIDTL